MTTYATVGAAIAAIVRAVPSITEVYLRFAPETAVPPYGTMLDNLGTVPILRGDGKTTATSRLVSVDIWQTVADEDDGLPTRVMTALDGAVLSIASGKVYQCGVESLDDVPEEFQSGVVHSALSIHVRQRLDTP